MSRISLFTDPCNDIRSNRIHGIMLILCSIFLLGACAPKPLYYWGNYEESIYNNNLMSDPEKAFF